MKKLFVTGMIALSLLFGASRLEASSVESNRALNSQIEKKQEQQELSARQKQLNETIKKAMAEVQRQQVEKIAKNHYMPINSSAAYDGKSITLSAKHELKNEDAKLAKLGADFTVDEYRRAKSVVLRGENDIGSLVMSFDLQTRNSVISMSAGKKGYGANLMLRNGDPTISARADILGKELRVSSTYNPAADYIATNFTGELKFGLRYAIGKEWIGDKDRTSILIAYNMPRALKSYLEDVSVEHFTHGKMQGNKISAKSGLGPVKLSIGFDNYADPKKYTARFKIDFKKSF